MSRSNALTAPPPPSLAERLYVESRELATGGMSPASIYRALRAPGNGIVIENGGSAGSAFIAVDPLETFAFNDDPEMMGRIRGILHRYRSGLEYLPPAYGLVCAFSYDAAISLHQVTARKKTGRLFGDAIVFAPGTWLSIDRSTESTTLSVIYTSNDARRAAIRRLDEYAARIEAAKSATFPASPVRQTLPATQAKASLSRDAFLENVAQAQRAIRNGDVYQLVLSIQFACQFDGDPLSLYETLTQKNPSPYAYLVEHDGKALVGASPEFLVRLSGDRAVLRPLAGTRPRGETPQHDDALAVELRSDVKENAEHVMLVDLGRNDLSAVCRVGTVRVDRALEIERYSHVMHLASSVSGTIAEGCDAFDLFVATFPAGTVTGTPKRRAMELISQLEPTARDLYAGSVAHFRCDGSMDAALTLRSIATGNGRAVWQAGAGIVHRSQPDLEYAEVLAKTRIARTVLGIAEPHVA